MVLFVKRIVNRLDWRCPAIARYSGLLEESVPPAFSTDITHAGLASGEFRFFASQARLLPPAVSSVGLVCNRAEPIKRGIVDS